MADIVDEFGLGAVLAECESVRCRLDAIRQPPFAHATQRMAQVYLVYLDAIQRAVQTTLRQQLDGEIEVDRVTKERVLMRDVTQSARRIFAAVRHLENSHPDVVPTAIQHTFASLLAAHWPSENAGISVDDVIVFVRGQWDYNYTCEQLPNHLRDCLLLDNPNPEELLERICPSTNGLESRDVLTNLWKSTGASGRPPRGAFALSLPRVTRDDFLLSPMLAHELGHVFVSLLEERLSPHSVLPQEWFWNSSAPPGATEASDGSTTGTAETTAVEIDLEAIDYDRALAEESGQDDTPYRLDAVRDALIGRFQVAGLMNAPDDSRVLYTIGLVTDVLREIAADYVALRLLGFPYLCALTEFLKPEADPANYALIWYPQEKGRPAYPAFALRVKLLAQEFLHGGPAGVCGYDQLQALRAIDTTGAVDAIVKYLDALANTEIARPSAIGADYEVVVEFAQQHIQSAVAPLAKQVRETVRPDNPPLLTSNIPEIVAALNASERHALAIDATAGYADLAGAGWMYQLAHGDREENTMKGRFEADGHKLSRNASVEHYQTTNQLLWDALNKIVSREQHPQLDQAATSQ